MQGIAMTRLVAGTSADTGQVAAGVDGLVVLPGVDFAALLALHVQDDAVAWADLPATVPGKGKIEPEILFADAPARDDVSPEAVLDPALIAVLPLPAATPAEAPVAPIVSAFAAAQDTPDALAPAMVAVQSARAPVAGLPPQLTLKGEEGEMSAPDPAMLAITPFAAVAAGRERPVEFATGGKELPPVADTAGAAAQLPVAAGMPSRPEAIAIALPHQPLSPAAPLAETRTAGVAIPQPVGSPDWGDALGQKVVFLAGQQQQVAELRLNPPQLGPLEVRLSISNDQVNAIFTSHQPAVREAIEAAMPRLREMLAEGGMMLGNAMVGSDSMPQRQFSGEDGRPGAAGRAEPGVIEPVPLERSVREVLSSLGNGRGGVDLFA